MESRALMMLGKRSPYQATVPDQLFLFSVLKVVFS